MDNVQDRSSSRANLSPNKRALLEKRLRRSAERVTPASVIPRRQAGPVPLSYAQQRLWFLDRFAPDAPNHISCAFRVTGALRGDALQLALDAIVARHEALRTTYEVVDENPVQVVQTAQPVRLNFIDLSGTPEGELDAEVERRISGERDRPFNLSKDCMLRGAVLRLTNREYILILTTHHIASDGWSFGIIFDELTATYKACLSGEPAALVPLPIQYADYTVWQRQCLQGAELEKLIDYWKRQLAGCSEILELPVDHPRPAKQSLRGAGYVAVLPPALIEAIKALSSREGVTLFMTLLAAWQALLYRYTQQEDLIVGSFVANRNRVEVERLIGFFVNSVALRTQVAGERSFRRLLQQVREVTLGAFAHQELPFEKLLEVLNPKRSLDRTPLFQVVILHHNEPNQGLALPGLTFSPIKRAVKGASYDLMLEIGEAPDQLKLTFVYSTDLFEAATIERLAKHYQTLLEGIVHDIEQPVNRLPLLSEPERCQLLRSWNQTPIEYPVDQCLHHLFEAQVLRSPQATAVEFLDQPLTYAELNHRANQLAHCLRHIGVGPDVLVALCVERSLEMVVGLLGILKAGGAYVPMDPAYPAERLAFMMSDADARVLVTQKRLLSSLPPHACQVVCLDDWETLEIEPQSNPDIAVRPTSLAYVIYTSGSTGKPKGVLIEHRAIVNHTLSACDAYAITPRDRLLQFASLSFDASAEEIYPCLASGATLVVRTDGMIGTAAGFLQRCAECKLTLLDLPTAYWHQLVHQMETERLAWPECIRLVILGGERAWPERLAAWQKLVRPQVQLVNTYGPTETTIVATRWKAPSSDRGWDPLQEIPIGQPISNTCACILDGEGQPVPAGVVGELHIGGAGLARGYLNQPELTAEKFLSNPFREIPTDRLYRTGDRARFQVDGNLEFRGRVDRQVKVRGYRIEPGEIEAALAKHPAVRDTAVLFHDNPEGQARLVAYVVPKEAGPSTVELRSFLQKTVPDYMLPAAFVLLAALPLNASGKVDRRALPAPQLSASDFEKNYVGPRNDLERRWAEIWQGVLKLQRVGVHDNFFELGGHSLLAILLFSRLRQEFKTEMPVRLLFQAPTIASLAQLVTDEQQKGHTVQEAISKAWSFLTPIQPLGANRPFYLLPGGLGSDEEFVVYARMARHLGFDQPFYGMKARCAGGRAKPHRNVEEMAADYIKEIRLFQPTGPYLLVGECAGGLVAFEMARQLVSQGQKVGLLALFDSLPPRRTEYLRNCLHRVNIAWRKSLLRRTIYHLGRLRQVEPGQRQAYLLKNTNKAKQRISPIFTRHRLEATDEASLADVPKDPLFDDYYQTLIRYRPKPYAGAVTLLINEALYRCNMSLGWQDYVLGSLEIHILRGNHLTYIREHVQSTAERLRACLVEAGG